ncbi:M23 family metallopeptidase [Aureimonas sp. AU12]|uniref:M23 family metallopeptidase n=1 Tax=Aureimonas sp. AU12 TaxID=1638161 RepID=UPI000AAECC2C|nr:M23 family metallopeptidase [Aureimonas sp. AU12]
MSLVTQRDVFGKRSAPHTIVIARGDKVRHWTVRPWLLATGTALAGLLVVAGIGATGVFFLGGHVVEALQTREARATAAYEQRIADLRNQLDKITTRQHVVRETVGAEVEKLIDQQVELADRFEQLEPLLAKARAQGLLPSSALPSPEIAAPSSDGPLPAWKSTDLRRSFDDVRALPGERVELAELAGHVLPTIRRSAELADAEQSAQVAALAKRAETKADRVATLLSSIGVDLRGEATDGVGGPFVPVSAGDGFADSLAQLDASLSLLEKLKTRSDRLPLAEPMPGGTQSSVFGVRLDPFFGREAMHTGVDFAIRSGTPVHPTAPGRVTSAGEAGGYGLMVEVDHGAGVSTRYGHLSRVDVAVGDAVETGNTIGAVGSTGRSTGPHLHYEVRLADQAVDPERYIRAGRKLAAL